MISFGMRCALIFVFVLSDNLAFVHGKNMTRERIAPGKVARNFFKAPWINLESSWKDKLNTVCKNDIVTLFDSADAREMWALKMLDASSKIPSGILTGNIHDLGMYDECIGVNRDQNPANIQGRHCMVSMSIPSKLLEDPSEQLFVQKLSAYNPSAGVDFGLTLSVCVPSSCGVEDVKHFVTVSIDSTQVLFELETRVTKVTCSKAVDSAEDLSLGTVLTLLFFATVVALQFLFTICGFLINANPEKASPIMKKMAKFSFYTNAKKLLSTSEKSAESMPTIHGLRVFSSCLVFLWHRIVVVLVKPLVNLRAPIESKHSVIAPFFLWPVLIVDTFFVMAGFFAAYVCLKRLQSGRKFDAFAHYVHRYLRLTPCIAVVILFTIYILPYLGSGPLWDNVVGQMSETCRKNWWMNILYIHNFHNVGDMCLLHTWYLAVEMHLFWMCPMILLPLHYRPKLGLTILGLFSIAAFVIPAMKVMVNNRAALINLESKNFADFADELSDIYSITYHRALPYLAGIFLAYDLVNNKRHLTPTQVSVNWILVAFLVTFCSWVTTLIQPNFLPFNIFWELMYVSVIRLAWSATSVWILYAVTQGYGGSLTKFLSLPIFVPLSRLSYCVYLVHFVIQIADNARVRTAEFYTAIGEISPIGGHLVIYIVSAILLNLCIETPVAILEDIWRDKGPSNITEPVSTENEQTLSSILKEYLQLTRGRVPSDSAIEKIVSQIHSRQTVANAPNSSREKHWKTSADWEKILQNWESNILKHDESWQNPAEDVHNDHSEQFQNRIITLEKKLCTCLIPDEDLAPSKDRTTSDISASTPVDIQYHHQKIKNSILRSRKL